MQAALGSVRGKFRGKGLTGRVQEKEKEGEIVCGVVGSDKYQ
jgi:hypothetical protein